ncbi:MAG: hypothetical protein QF886_07150, partial [Planctomycetota bacterium]|nr:hypothetical protein [Planctomycetota bacterium]
RRYQSVGELQQDINLFLEGRSVSAKEDSPFEAISKLIKRNKGIAGAIGVAALIIIAVVGVAFKNVSSERDKALLSENKAKLSEQKATKAMAQQRKDALAASKRFAFQAIQAAEMGRMIDAERRLDDARTVASGSPWAHFGTGRLAEHNKDFAAAEKEYKAALKIDSRLSEVKMALGKLRARSGDVDAAQKLLAGIADAKDWKELLRAGKVLYQAGQWEESTKVYKKALTLMEKSEDAERELKTKEYKDLVDEARFSLEDAKAHLLCKGFVDSIRHLGLQRQGEAIARKLAEINGDEPCFGRQSWRYMDEHRKFLNAAWHQCNNLRFLHPLSGLPIQKLQLTAMPKLTQIHALAGLPLKFLNLGGCRIVDISPLRGMPLEELDLIYNPITDLTPLVGMRLRTLALSYGIASDLSPLKGMDSLESLQCRHTAVEDISPLAGMPLKSLSIRATKVRDISVLKGMPLEDLEMNEGLTDFSVLEGMKLKRLYLHDSPIDLKILKDMPLENLQSVRCKIEDLSPLRGKALKLFNAPINKFTDLSPLEGAPLERLNLDYCKVTDLSPLRRSKIVHASFKHSKVVDLTPLTDIETMHRLDFHYTKVNSLVGFEKFTDLRHLGLPHTEVSDLSPLKNVKSLAHLEFSGTEVTSIEPLRNLNLNTCDMAHVAVTDLTPLANMKRLGRLTISEEQQFTEESKAVIEKLKEHGTQVRVEAAPKD